MGGQGKGPPQADELGDNENKTNNNDNTYQNGSGQRTVGGHKCPPSLAMEVTSARFEAPCATQVSFMVVASARLEATSAPQVCQWS